MFTYSVWQDNLLYDLATSGIHENGGLYYDIDLKIWQTPLQHCYQMYSNVHTLSFYTHYALATVGYDFLDSVRQLYTQGFYWISIGWIFLSSTIRLSIPNDSW